MRGNRESNRPQQGKSAITGGDQVTARGLYEEAIEFKFTAKLNLVANHAPRIAHDDSGLWRRIVRLPFEHVIPEAERSSSIKAQLGPHVVKVAYTPAGGPTVEREVTIEVKAPIPNRDTSARMNIDASMSMITALPRCITNL